MITFIYLYTQLLLLETLNKCLYKSRTTNYRLPIGASEIIHHTPSRLVQNAMRVVSCRLEDMSCPFSFLAFPSLSFTTLFSTYEKMFHFWMIERSKMSMNRRADRQDIWIFVQLRPLFVYTSTSRCPRHETQNVGDTFGPLPRRPKRSLIVKNSCLLPCTIYYLGICDFIVNVRRSRARAHLS
jgi:hypothetical protein